jgi:NADPH:quinone reductase
VPADRVVRIPSGLSDDLAVGGFLMGMTALSLVREAYAVHKGEKVLVHAAAGGVGLLLCQLLREVGAFVIGTAGGEAKGRLAKEHGADVVVDYARENWVERVMEVTEGKGVDVVYDGVGESTWEGSLAVTRRKGKGMCSFCCSICILGRWRGGGGGGLFDGWLTQENSGLLRQRVGPCAAVPDQSP